MVEYDKYSNQGDVVQAIIRASSSGGIQSVCSPWEGDCGSVARAIREVHGGELVGYFPSEDAGIPLHVMVEIDGQLVDGTGKVKNETIIQYFSGRHDGRGYIREMKEIPGFMVDRKKKRKIKEILEEEA